MGYYQNSALFPFYYPFTFFSETEATVTSELRQNLLLGWYTNLNPVPVTDRSDRNHIYAELLGGIEEMKLGGTIFPQYFPTPTYG